CLMLGDDDRARDLITAVVKIRPTNPWLTPEVPMLHSLTLEREGKMVEARAAYEESLRQSRRLRYILGEALALSVYAGIPTTLDPPEEMRRRYERAIEIFEKLKAKPLLDRTRQALERLDNATAT